MCRQKRKKTPWGTISGKYWAGRIGKKGEAARKSKRRGECAARRTRIEKEKTLSSRGKRNRAAATESLWNSAIKGKSPSKSGEEKGLQESIRYARGTASGGGITVL